MNQNANIGFYNFIFQQLQLFFDTYVDEITKFKIFKIFTFIITLIFMNIEMNCY